jgi:hypothetical protein
MKKREAAGNNTFAFDVLPTGAAGAAVPVRHGVVFVLILHLMPFFSFLSGTGNRLLGSSEVASRRVQLFIMLLTTGSPAGVDYLFFLSCCSIILTVWSKERWALQWASKSLAGSM